METAPATPILSDASAVGSPRKRIVFVDDEPNILQGLRRLFSPFRQEWDMIFVGSGAAALTVLAQTACDVVVSDMRMPGMDGVELLQQVKRQYPQIVRIVLSGHSDHGMLMRSAQVAHQYLAKPCDATLLQTTIARTCALQGLLRTPALHQLVTGLTTLPSLPTLYLQIIEAMQDPNVAMGKVGTIIGRDIAMTAKVLQLVNSAFFGLRRAVTTPTEAVRLLGLETIKTLVLSLQLFAQCDAARLRACGLGTLWHHSLMVGLCAQKVVTMEQGDRSMREAAFTAGVLHDVGQLVLAANLPEHYGAVGVVMQAHGVTDWQAEQDIFGVTHATVGAYLLGLWGLPESLVEAVAFHHAPGACPAQHALSPLTAIAVANRLVSEGPAREPVEMEHTMYLAALGLSDRLGGWRTQCQALIHEEHAV
jgi:HD-like signal output (HDOD) protein